MTVKAQRSQGSVMLVAPGSALTALPAASLPAAPIAAIVPLPAMLSIAGASIYSGRR